MPPKPVPDLPSEPLPTPALTDTKLRLTYTYTPNETLVLTLEPYKSLLLPFWRFVNPELARPSSSTLYSIFESYVERGDFVGADMTRKFIQMGMTRAKRYANHKGGRKYDRTGLAKGELARDRKGDDKVPVLDRWEPEKGGKEWEKRREKLEVSSIFRGYWERCKSHEGYGQLKERWEEEKKAWREKGCPIPEAVDVGPSGVPETREIEHAGSDEKRKSQRLRGK